MPSPLKAGLALFLRRGPFKYACFQDEKLDFADFQERFFASAQRCPVYSKALSSRHFDAIGTQTCQILTVGRYNDLLKPNEHYIPINLDLSNIDEASARFKDPQERQRIALAAYEHAMCTNTYSHRLATLHRTLQSL
jgi:spore maturation protein CgeB